MSVINVVPMFVEFTDTNLPCEFQNFARTHSPTRLMSSENTYSLSKEHCNLKYSGECKDCSFQKYFQHHPACSGHCKTL